MDQKTADRIALMQSAYDSCCAPEDFFAHENRAFVSRASASARRYLTLPHICDLVSYGPNVVVSGREDVIGDVLKYVDASDKTYDCFETPAVYGLNEVLAPYDARICFMAAYFLPDVARIEGLRADCGFHMRVLTQKDFQPLYVPAWQNALCEKRKELDVLGVGAYDGGTLVGLAGCSADCADMWQIGVDVLPAWRMKGIGSALVTRLAQEILARGKVPFYCAAWSNIKSVKNALKCGFRPGWTQATAKSVSFIADMLRERNG